MFYRFSAVRIEIAQTVQGLLELKSDSIGIVQRLEALFTAAHVAKVDVFAGDETYHKRWRSLLKGLAQADRVRLLTDYLGAERLNDCRNLPSDVSPYGFLDPAYVKSFVEYEDGDLDGEPVGMYSYFLKTYLEWTPITPPRLQGDELRALLAQLGEVYEVPLGKNKNSVAVVLKLAEVKRFLGIEDLTEVFVGVEGLRQESGEKNGFIVDVDLHQQKALLAAIVNVGAIHELPLHSLGFYNLRGSRKLYDVLNAQGFYGRTNILWIWTGEKYVPNQAEDAYPEPEILTLDSIGEIRDGRFCLRYVGNGLWYDDAPVDRLDDDGVVFGLSD